MPPEHIFDFLNRHVPVSRETIDRFIRYHDLLIKWQAKINLVGKDSLSDIWQRHFLDSLQIISHLPDTDKPVIDVGTGAGFPGMVLAIAGVKNIHLVEGDGKKISFLNEAARITHTNISIHHGRIEALSISDAGVIMARAVAELATLLALISDHVSHETICLFPKGKNWSKEITDAKQGWRFDHSVIPSITDSEGVILKLSNIKRR